MADPLTYDVIVIGAGPPGEVAAGRCADGGLKVAICESELVGGECSYWGCIPSKTLIRPGDVVAAARRVPGAREAVTGPIDAAAAFGQRDYMTSNWDDTGAVKWLKDKGIHVLRGKARLTGPRAVAVGDTSAVATRAVVLAVGSDAAMPPIPGLAEAKPWTNREATGARVVPAHLVVLGGGAIGVEMAQAFKRLGSAAVTVIEGAPRLLAREEPFAGEQVATAFAAEGIDVLLGAKVVGVRRSGSVTVELDDGRTVTGDELLAAVGRRPRTGGIGLDTVGLAELDGRFTEVDDQLRVRGSDWLYAVGDCNGRALLTHMGKYQARICGDVILGRPGAAVRPVIPRVTFTDPQVGAVGMTADDARQAGVDVRVVAVDTGSVAGAYVEGEGIAGTSQLVVDHATSCVVGATFTGPGVQEMVHAATIAIVGRVPLADLWHAVPSFPTVSEVWLRLLEEYGL